jgi:hypothetical protein
MTRLSYGPADHTINTEDKPNPAHRETEIGIEVTRQLIKIDGELTDARALLEEVFADSGFRNLFEPLQDKISAFVN